MTEAQMETANESAVEVFNDLERVYPKKARAYDLSKKQLAKNLADYKESINLSKLALSQMTNYTDALCLLSESGRNGETAMNKLTTSLQGMASTASLTLVPGSAQAAELLNFVSGKITEIRATKKLKKAVIVADEGIGTIVDVLVKNLEGSKFMAQGAGILIESSLSESAYYDEPVEIYNEAIKKRTKLILLIQNTVPGYPIVSIPSKNETKEDAFAEARKYHEELTYYEELITRFKPFHDEYASEMVLAVEENKATLEMIDIAVKSLNQWGQTHHQLANALANKQPFSILSLSHFVENAKTVEDKIKNIQQLKLASQTN
jgi:tetratricopeptide (TPR) repeat protein